MCKVVCPFLLHCSVLVHRSCIGSSLVSVDVIYSALQHHLNTKLKAWKCFGCILEYAHASAEISCIHTYKHYRLWQVFFFLFPHHVAIATWHEAWAAFGRFFELLRTEPPRAYEWWGMGWEAGLFFMLVWDQDMFCASLQASPFTYLKE